MDQNSTYSITRNLVRKLKLICSLLLILSFCNVANSQEFKEGIDYEVLPGEAKVLRDGRVEVNEFFWYGCPSCFNFEPLILDWVANHKPNAIKFVPIPAVGSDRWTFHARVYYALENSGLVDELSMKFFDELHINRSRIYTYEALREWLSEQDGVDVEAIIQSMSSFATMTKLNQSNLLAGKYQLSGVPLLVVGGKYKTSGALAGTNQRALETVEYLAAKILAEQGNSN